MRGGEVTAAWVQHDMLDIVADLLAENSTISIFDQNLTSRLVEDRDS
jgi:hypothetical protein